MTEDHNVRLTQTVDKLLSESNERLQLHLKERMHSLDEKTALSEECEKIRRHAEEVESEKEKICIELAQLRAEIEVLRRDNLILQQNAKELSHKHDTLAKMNAVLRTTNEKEQTFKSSEAAKKAKSLMESSDLDDIKIERALLENDPSSLLTASDPLPQQSTLTNASMKSSRARQFNLPNKLSPMLFDSDLVDISAAAGLMDTSNAAFKRVQERFQQLNTLQAQQQQQASASAQVLTAAAGAGNEGECDWDKLEEASKVIANVQHAFEMSDPECHVAADAIENEASPYTFNSLNRQFSLNRSNAAAGTKSPSSFAFANVYGNTDSGERGGSAGYMNKLKPQSDAQTIAIMIQKQLEDIDNEIR